MEQTIEDELRDKLEIQLDYQPDSDGGNLLGRLYDGIDPITVRHLFKRMAWTLLNRKDRRAESQGGSSGRDAMNGYSYTGEIAELKAQIEHQRVGSREVQDAMQKQDRRIAELERENRLLKDGLSIGSPREYWPDPA